MQDDSSIEAIASALILQYFHRTRLFFLVYFVFLAAQLIQQLAISRIQVALALN